MKNQLKVNQGWTEEFMVEKNNLRPDFMSPEEARTVPLSKNPFKRSGQVKQLIAKHFEVKPAGINAGIVLLGRRNLIRMAEAMPGYYDEAEELIRGLGELSIQPDQQIQVESLQEGEING